MISVDLSAVLMDGLDRLGEQADSHTRDQYMRYLDLLAEWNQAYNLTAIRDRQDMVAYHLLDSLAVLPHLKGGACLDVGSGAGLPGLVLAMARPQQHWVLLDSNSKKIRFIRHVQMTLGLKNVEIVQERVQRYKKDQCFNTAVSRAFSSLAEFYQAVRRLLTEGGRVMAMKGELHREELQELEQAGISYATVKLDVPGLEKQRHLVLIDI